MVFGQVITGKDLYDKLQAFLGTDDDLTEVTVATWLDTAIAEFPEIAFTALKETYNDVLAKVEYELPMDFDTIDDILIYDSTTNTYSTYNKKSDVVFTKDDMVKFPSDLDTITLLYNPVQQPYTDCSIELPLKRSLRPCLFYYLVCEYYQKEGEGSIEEERISSNYRKRYESAKAIAIAKLENRDSTGPTETTDAMYKSSRVYASRTDFDKYDGNNDVEE
jgi:hypothetical protein